MQAYFSFLWSINETSEIFHSFIFFLSYLDISADETFVSLKIYVCTVELTIHRNK